MFTDMLPMILLIITTEGNYKNNGPIINESISNINPK